MCLVFGRNSDAIENIRRVCVAGSLAAVSKVPPAPQVAKLSSAPFVVNKVRETQ